MSECKFRGYVRTAKTFMCARNGIEGVHGCPDYHLKECQYKTGGQFMGWKEQAKEALGGRYIKFNEEMPEHTVTFEGEPEAVEVESTFKKGETYTSFEFPVTEGGKSKILGVTAKALMSLLIEEDDEESIVGRTFKIKSIGTGKNRTWKLREVHPDKPGAQAELPEKEKFLKEVKKHEKKEKAKKSTISPDEEGKGLVDLGGAADEQAEQAE